MIETKNLLPADMNKQGNKIYAELKYFTFYFNRTNFVF